MSWWRIPYQHFEQTSKQILQSYKFTRLKRHSNNYLQRSTSAGLVGCLLCPGSWLWRFQLCPMAPLQVWWFYQSASSQRSAFHLADAGPSEEWILSGCCSQKVCGHPQVAFLKWDIFRFRNWQNHRNQSKLSFNFPGLHPSLSADGLVTLGSARGGAKRNPKNQSSSDLFYWQNFSARVMRKPDNHETAQWRGCIMGGNSMGKTGNHEMARWFNATTWQ